MVKKKVKKEVKKAVKVKTIKVKVSLPEPKDDLKETRKKYDELVNEIVSSNLLTNSQLKSGGEAIRQKYTCEVGGFTPVIDEINTLGKQLGLPSIGLGSLRK